jgi:hypothetical protein
MIVGTTTLGVVGSVIGAASGEAWPYSDALRRCLSPTAFGR